MTTSVKMSLVDEIPSDARVCHVDELDWPAKSQLSEFDVDERVDVDDEVAKEFSCCDVVKYTEYYEISLD